LNQIHFVKNLNQIYPPIHLKTIITKSIPTVKVAPLADQGVYTETTIATKSIHNYFN
jgi:hypothetical protein